MSFTDYKNNINNRIAVLVIGFLSEKKETEYKDITNYYLVGQPNPICDSLEIIQTRLDQLIQFNVAMNFEDLFSVSFENSTIQDIYFSVKKQHNRLILKLLQNFKHFLTFLPLYQFRRMSLIYISLQLKINIR